MIVLIALVAGMVFWIAGWALGLKSFDAFMVCALFLLTAFAIRTAAPFVKRQLGRE